MSHLVTKTISTAKPSAYKGYIIQPVGISRHVYRPDQIVPGYARRGSGSAHVCQSMTAAKRWIDAEWTAGDRR